MKKLVIAFIFIAGCTKAVQAQTIDNNNYYDFQKNSGNLNWLRSCDVVPIIIDELLKNGIPYHTISVGDLIKVNDSTRFVVTVSFSKGDKDYGILYEANHGLPLNRKDRAFLTDQKKVSYVQAEKDNKGDVNFMRIDPIPDNIFLLKETCYWFQFDSNGTKYPVNKEIAQNILRQDLGVYLKTLKN